MKKNLAIVAMFVLVLGFLVIFVTGCAKKEFVKEEAPAVKEIPEAVQPSKAELQRQEREAALKEKMLAEKEAALKEKMLAEKEAAQFENIQFDFDKFNLKPKARETLRRHADWLLEHHDFDVVIEGHCDERGTNEYNLALGERRAASAMKYLVNLGINKKRLTTISYGEELPLDPRHNKEAWAKNRRDHFVVTARK